MNIGQIKKGVTYAYTPRIETIVEPGTPEFARINFHGEASAALLARLGIEVD